MATLDELVGKAVAQEKDSAIADITAKATSERNELDQLQASIRAEANELIGFKTGATPTAYLTERAGVLIRDPLSGESSSVGPVSLPSAPSDGAMLAVLGLLLLIFWKGKG